VTAPAAPGQPDGLRAAVKSLLDEAATWTSYSAREVGEVYLVDTVDDLLDNLSRALADDDPSAAARAALGRVRDLCEQADRLSSPVKHRVATADLRRALGDGP
jgi:hypothetical protein